MNPLLLLLGAGAAGWFLTRKNDPSQGPAMQPGGIPVPLPGQPPILPPSPTGPGDPLANLRNQPPTVPTQPHVVTTAPTPEAPQGGTAVVVPPPVQPQVGPRPPVEQLDQAKQLADVVIEDIKAKGSKYDRMLLARFQKLAELIPDGLYGGRSAGALMYFTAKSPPAPIFQPKTIVAYRPRGMG